MNKFNMKTTKSFLAALIVICAMTTTVFTACGDDDDNINNSVDDNKPVAAVMVCELTVGDDMFNVLDLTVEYYDANGQVQSEQMTAKNWKKTVLAKLPATLGARLKIQVKNGIDPASLDVFTEDVKYAYSVNPVNASGKEQSGGQAYISHPTLDMPGDKVADWVAKHSNGLVKFLYTVNSNGQVTESTWQ